MSAAAGLMVSEDDDGIRTRVAHTVLELHKRFAHDQQKHRRAIIMSPVFTDIVAKYDVGELKLDMCEKYVTLPNERFIIWLAQPIHN